MKNEAVNMSLDSFIASSECSMLFIASKNIRLQIRFVYFDVPHYIALENSIVHCADSFIIEEVKQMQL